MIDEITFDTLAAGVIGNFVSDALRHLSHDTIKKIAPSAFRGGHRLLAEADREFELAKKTLLARHSEDKTLSLFLSPEKTIKDGVLHPLFEHIFCNATLDKQKIIDAYLDCTPTGTSMHRPRATKVVTDVVDTIKNAFLSNLQLSSFVLHASVQEIKSSFDTLNILNALLSNPPRRPLVSGGDIEEFSRDYVSYLKRQVRDLVINGLDAATRKEIIRQDILRAFVPVSLSSCLLDPMTKLSSLNPFVYRENAFDVIYRIPRVIIRGPAGSGKTTILHWLISHCDLFERDCELPSLPFLPIYIPLRKLEGIQNLDWEINELSHHVIANSVLQKRLPDNFISRITWPLLFMFDGVHEITEHNRDQFWTCVYEICAKWPQSHIIITSRNLSICHLANSTYRDDIYTSPDTFTAAARQWRPPAGFLEFTVAPLSIEEIVHFVDSWFMGVDEKLIPDNQRGDIQTFPKRLKFALFLPENRGVLELSRTPLLCALVCMVFFLRGGRLPKNRKDLYAISTRLREMNLDRCRYRHLFRSL